MNFNCANLLELLKKLQFIWPINLQICILRKEPILLILLLLAKTLIGASFFEIDVLKTIKMDLANDTPSSDDDNVYLDAKKLFDQLESAI